MFESNRDCFRGLMCGANRSPAHVSDREGCIRVLLSEVLGIAVLGIACATRTSVQPVHVGGHVIPERDDEGHATLHGLAKLLHTTIVLEVWRLTILVHQVLAEFLSHRVSRSQAQVRVLDLLAILVVILVHAIKLTALL